MPLHAAVAEVRSDLAWLVGKSLENLSDERAWKLAPSDAGPPREKLRKTAALQERQKFRR